MLSWYHQVVSLGSWRAVWECNHPGILHSCRVHYCFGAVDVSSNFHGQQTLLAACHNSINSLWSPLLLQWFKAAGLPQLTLRPGIPHATCLIHNFTAGRTRIPGYGTERALRWLHDMRKQADQRATRRCNCRQAVGGQGCEGVPAPHPGPKRCTAGGAHAALQARQAPPLLSGAPMPYHLSTVPRRPAGK